MSFLYGNIAHTGPSFGSSGASSNISSSTATTTHMREKVVVAAPAAPGTIRYRYSLADAAAETKTETLPVKPFTLRLIQNGVSYPIIPGSVSFIWSKKRYSDNQGRIFKHTAEGLVLAGSINYSTATVTLDVYDGGDNTLNIQSLAGRLGSQFVTEASFRTPGAPLRPGSLSLNGVTITGERFSVVGGFDGKIEGDHVRGMVDYENGVVIVGFGRLVLDSAEHVGEPWYDPAMVQDDGRIWKPEPIYADTLRFGCVVYSYIPLDAGLIGLNPVRLPRDGRVPIVKPGDICVIHNTEQDVLPSPLTGGQQISLSRTGVSSVEIYDSSDVPKRVPTSMYAFDGDVNRIIIDAENNDFSGFTSPLICMHKIEDMVLVSGTQINGALSFNHGVTHDYPVKGTYISSALPFGDLQSRVYGLFDQKTWKNVFSDDIDGDPATGTYNEINFSIIVTNAGTVKERWAIVLTSDTHFRVIGESRGVVCEGYTTQDCAPINPATNQPFFTIPYGGWGSGWAAGNVVRFNTDGANPAFWIVRTTLQGPAQEPEDFFTIQIRGDAE